MTSVGPCLQGDGSKGGTGTSDSKGDGLGDGGRPKGKGRGKYLPKLPGDAGEQKGDAAKGDTKGDAGKGDGGKSKGGGGDGGKGGGGKKGDGKGKKGDDKGKGKARPKGDGGTGGTGGGKGDTDQQEQNRLAMVIRGGSQSGDHFAVVVRLGLQLARSLSSRAAGERDTLGRRRGTGDPACCAEPAGLWRARKGESLPPHAPRQNF